MDAVSLQTNLAALLPVSMMGTLETGVATRDEAGRLFDELFLGMLLKDLDLGLGEVAGGSNGIWRNLMVSALGQELAYGQGLGFGRFMFEQGQGVRSGLMEYSGGER